ALVTIFTVEVGMSSMFTTPDAWRSFFESWRDKPAAFFTHLMEAADRTYRQIFLTQDEREDVIQRKKITDNENWFLDVLGPAMDREIKMNTDFRVRDIQPFIDAHIKEKVPQYSYPIPTGLQS